MVIVDGGTWCNPGPILRGAVDLEVGSFSGKITSPGSKTSTAVML